MKLKLCHSRSLLCTLLDNAEKNAMTLLGKSYLCLECCSCSPAQFSTSQLSEKIEKIRKFEEKISALQLWQKSDVMAELREGKNNCINFVPELCVRLAV